MHKYNYDGGTNNGYFPYSVRSPPSEKVYICYRRYISNTQDYIYFGEVDTSLEISFGMRITNLQYSIDVNYLDMDVSEANDRAYIAGGINTYSDLIFHSV